MVLGETGKNFAAGMSGGLAFVYDQDRLFKKRCNLSLVDIEQVTDPDYAALLKSMVEEHYQLTGSKRAKLLLDNWKKHLTEFVLVIPLEYRKILATTNSTKAS